ncbi:primosomal protein DnaI [Lapidilactobacillus bayanensis]|uniref:primosomal protein DnaI n=1 Tax=Lapidilactobacillus bayanensis TaxID=2485998 RepID=UPI000F768892|nr:primosomal protein DnaI [Lapidilactobacillus bayanensis]
MRSISDFFTKYLHRQELNHNYRELISKALADSDVQTFLAAHSGELNEAGVEKSAAAIYEYVANKNAQTGKGAISAAGYESFLRVNNGYVEVVYQPDAKLVAQQQASQQASRVTTVNLPKDLANISFNDYDQQFPGRLPAFEAAIDLTTQLIQRPDNNTYVKGLYLCGPFGIGKTYLLGAIANNLAQNNIVSTLVHFPTFAVQMKQAINDHQVWQRLEALEKTPVLMIDDIGADSLSPWVRDEVLGVILQYRMQERLTTCFTSNLAMTELATYLSQTGQGIDATKSARIMERIQFLATEYQMDGPNLRQNTLN